MGLFGRFVNQVRNNFGLDTTADAMDRKINQTFQSEERVLSTRKEYVDSVIQTYQSEGQVSKMQLEIINRILDNYNKINDLATQEICKVSSGMKATLEDYHANYSSLKSYVDMLNKTSKDVYSNVSRIQNLELVKEKLIRRYIHAVLLHEYQDNNKLAENMEINTLYQLIQIDVKSLPIMTTDKVGYDYLEDIMKQCQMLKGNVDIKLSEIQAKANPYYNQNEQIEARLNDINKNRAMLKNTKEYISKDSDRRVIRK